MTRLSIKRLLKLVFIITLLYQGWLLLNVIYYNFYNPRTTSVMSIELSRLQQTKPDAKLQHQWVNYNNISPYIKQAVIASEDANFMTHWGADIDAMKKAWEHNTTGRRIRGGSTITQQLAKNLFLSHERNYLRKGQELVIAGMLETTMSKERILEIYLNTAEWGVGIFGIEAAAQHYYGVSAKALNARQSANLAAMLPRPKFYDEHRSHPALAKRSNTLINYMQGTQIP